MTNLAPGVVEMVDVVAEVHGLWTVAVRQTGLDDHKLFDEMRDFCRVERRREISQSQR